MTSQEIKENAEATESVSGKMLTVLCHNGVLSYRGLDVFEGSPNYHRKKLTQLRQRGWINTKDAELIKLKIPNKRYEKWSHYVDEGSIEKMMERTATRPSGKKKHVYRQGKQSEVMAMVLEIGGTFHTKDIKEIDKSNFSYVVAEQIKNDESLGLEKQMAAQSSRAMGTLFTPEQTYTFYSIGDSAATSYVEGEKAYRNRVMQIEKELGIENNGESRCVIVSEGLLNLESYFFKKELIRDKKETYKKIPLCTNGTYDAMYLIPCSNEGSNILLMVTTENYKDIVDNYYLGDTLITKEIDCDGVEMRGDEVREYYLNFLVPDMTRLDHFYHSAITDDRNKYTIHCFDMYERGLKELCGDRIQIIPHKVEPVMNVWMFGAE